MSIVSKSTTRETIHLPLEILEKIAFNARDKLYTLMAASLVSKIWRAAFLRYIFDRAIFGMKHDFTHWQAVTLALPEVLNYLRDITFAPGVQFYAQSMARYHSRAEEFDEPVLTRKLADAASEYYKSLVDIALPPDIPLPIIPGAKRLTWATGFTQRMGRDMQTLTPATFRFLQSFPAVEVLSIEDEIPGEHVHDILCHFPLLKSFTWTRASVGRQLPGRRGFTSQFTAVLSHLEVLALNDPGAMVNPDPEYHYDWLVDMILSGDTPAPLREILIRVEQPFPFSVTAFARLLSAAAPTLQTLDIMLKPSIDKTFWKQVHSLTANAAFLALNKIKLAFPIDDWQDHDHERQWLTSVLVSISTAPNVTHIDIVYAIDRSSADLFTVLDFWEPVDPWEEFCNTLNARYPNLRTLRVGMAQQTTPGRNAKHVERNVLRALRPLKADVTVEWLEDEENY
ncbi:hypothetical protein CYLTODRAFT_439506 [Cylindrobasidium torrendii FP15055 ss-10]|uniref:F-box domain-containing protein n=1 Tax=Cylindrobasidium torrendii FP15055 ss-10 TaxID=1314674 RepID=A0A0D7BTH6_9AGAR|nr:hypothetical protein CYLTODRAFT_439506 [Cylindrobasidium torrendii FP15055 ss-10]